MLAYFMPWHGTSTYDLISLGAPKVDYLHEGRTVPDSCLLGSVTVSHMLECPSRTE